MHIRKFVYLIYLECNSCSYQIFANNKDIKELNYMKLHLTRKIN